MLWEEGRAEAGEWIKDESFKIPSLTGTAKGHIGIP